MVKYGIDMTVGELIKKMDRFHKKAEIMVKDNRDGAYYPIAYIFNEYPEPLHMDDNPEEVIVIEYEKIEPQL